MKSRVRCILTAAFVEMVIASVNPLAAVAQSNPPVDTAPAGSRVSINVVVTGGKSQPIPDLQAGDFTVFDNDEPQKLLGFRVVRVRDADSSSYKLTFKAANSDESDEFHTVAVRVDRPNLNIRTISGYYMHTQSLAH